MPVLPILLAIAARDLFLPVAGHIRDPLHDVRTSVTLRNQQTAEAHAKIEFRPAAGTPSPEYSLDVTIPPNGSREIDPFGERGGLGGLRITSDQPLTGNARIVTPASSSAPIDLLPSSLGIGSGDAATVGGFSFTHAATETNRLYIVETAGDALQYSVIILSADGKVLAQNMHLIHPYEQHSRDLDGDFPTVAASNVSVRLRGLNGGGRLVAGMAVTKRATGEIVTRAVAMPSERSHGLSTWEKVAYAAIALFLIGAALRRRR